MRPRVVTRKHYVQASLFAVAAGAKATVSLIDAVAVLDKNDPDEITEGSIISAVYLEYWLTTQDSSAGTSIVILEKVQSGSGSASATNMASLDTYDNKKNVLHVFMGLTNPVTGAGAMPAVRGWFKIPKSKQRFGLGDQLILSFFSQTGTLHGCGFSTYKEQM